MSKVVVTTTTTPVNNEDVNDEDEIAKEGRDTTTTKMAYEEMIAADKVAQAIYRWKRGMRERAGIVKKNS